MERSGVEHDQEEGVAKKMYHDVRHHAEIVSVFLRTGLSRPEKCICVLQGASWRSIHKSLLVAGIDLVAVRKNGLLELMRTQDLYSTRAALDPNRILRISGILT